MIKSAQNKPVAELLSVDSNWRFRVPRYQREYVWRRDDWANLFDDLWENPPGYFLGSMLCINRSDDAMQVQELEVVDGQQRLTTLSLLYAAIHACLAECLNKDVDDEELKHELFNLRYRLVYRGPRSALRLEPSYQGPLSEVNSTTVSRSSPSASIRSSSRLTIESISRTTSP